MVDKKYQLIVTSGDGGRVAELQTNEKGYLKSIETKKIWITDAVTGRLIPWNEEISFASISLKDECVSVVLKGTEEGMPVSNLFSAPPSLSSLKAAIKDRKARMPEGSYTTHLFKSGTDKIKKKLGEEAIEVILAKKREDLIYECADLIYHMMVLLENEGIDVEEVFAELENRK
jgi:phosphoribosyl-ATP pyrophosphohydrolase